MRIIHRFIDSPIAMFLLVEYLLRMNYSFQRRMVLIIITNKLIPTLGFAGE